MKYGMVVAGLLAIAGTAVAAGVPRPGALAEAWEVKVAPGECTLNRSIAAPVPVTLSLRTLTGSDSYRLALVGKTLPRQNARELFPVTLVFAGADRRFERKARGATLANGLGEAIILNGLEPEVIAAFGQASSIAIEAKSGTIGPFALPRARAAIAALAMCVRDQLVEWGADPGQFEPGGKMPVALIPRDDWVPSDQLRRLPIPDEMKVDAVFKAGVAADGTIDSCAQIGAGVDAKAARIVCDSVLTRRLFTPASDPQGKPVRGVAIFEIHLEARRVAA